MLWCPGHSIMLPWCRETPVSRIAAVFAVWCTHTEILSNQTEIRLYLPFSDRFGSKRTSVWIQINRKMMNTIWFRVDFLRFRKNSSVCNILNMKSRRMMNGKNFILNNYSRYLITLELSCINVRTISRNKQYTWKYKIW